MKPLLSLTTILALALPVPAFAAPAHAAPAHKGKAGSVPKSKANAAIQLEPAAIALLDRAITAYKAPNGMRLEFESSLQSLQRKIDITGTLQWKPPSGLVIERHSGDHVSLLLADGKNVFSFNDGRTYRRTSFVAGKKPPGAVAGLSIITAGGLGEFLPAFLTGRNLLREEQKVVARREGYHLYARQLPLTQITGANCNGLRLTFSFVSKKRKFHVETTGWFNAKNDLLRSAHQVMEVDGKRIVSDDKVLVTDLNPTFAPDTFVWTAPPGTREVAEDALDMQETQQLQQSQQLQQTQAVQGSPQAQQSQGSHIYWDPKLVPGATPYALTGKDLNGNDVSLSRYRGKVVLLDFWATWCPPCRAEVPSVVRNYRQYHRYGFDIIGISLDNNKQSLINFINAQGMTWPQIYDGRGRGTNSVRYKVQGIPFTLLIGKDGKIAAVNAFGAELEQAIKTELAR